MLVTTLFSRLGVGAIVLLSAVFADAQGFLLRPASLNITVKPGITNTVSFEVRNTTEIARSVDVTPLVLYQEEGGMKTLPLVDAKVPAILKRSALPWAKVDRASLENIPPLAKANFTLSLAVPSTAKGAYVMAIAVQSRPEKTQGAGVATVLRFVVPVVVTTEGVSSIAQLKPLGAKLEDLGKSGETAGATVLRVPVVNPSNRYSSCGGTVVVSQRLGSRTVRIGTFPIGPSGILPQSTGSLTLHIPKRLPSGTYRVNAALSADGKRISPYGFTVEHKSDPAVSAVSADVELLIEPAVVKVDVSPGAVRTATVKISNPSDQPIKVSLSPRTPKPLQGVSIGTVTGESFSGAEWVEAPGEAATIGANGSRTFRIPVKAPSVDLDKPVYYADVHFKVFTSTDEPIGSGQAMIQVENKGAKATPKIDAMEPPRLSAVSGTRYAFTVGLGNTGNVHLDPSAQGQILDGSAMVVGSQFLMTRPEGDLLPLGRSTVSGEFDAKGLKTGLYILRARVTAEGMEEAFDLPVRVTNSNGKITISTVDAKPSAAINPPVKKKAPAKPEKRQ